VLPRDIALLCCLTTLLPACKLAVLCYLVKLMRLHATSHPHYKHGSMHTHSTSTPTPPSTPASNLPTSVPTLAHTHTHSLYTRTCAQIRPHPHPHAQPINFTPEPTLAHTHIHSFYTHTHTHTHSPTHTHAHRAGNIPLTFPLPVLHRMPWVFTYNSWSPLYDDMIKVGGLCCSPRGCGVGDLMGWQGTPCHGWVWVLGVMGVGCHGCGCHVGVGVTWVWVLGDMGVG